MTQQLVLSGCPALVTAGVTAFSEFQLMAVALGLFSHLCKDYLELLGSIIPEWTDGGRMGIILSHT